MTARRYTLVLFLGVGLGLAGCGDREPVKTGPASVPVGCVAKWTTGNTATLQCTATGPDKDKVKVDKDTFLLDGICVNDARVTTFGFSGGQTAPIGARGDGPVLCAKFDGQAGKLPESCTCVPPPGGDCTPPPQGFVCIVGGHVPLHGG